MGQSESLQTPKEMWRGIGEGRREGGRGADDSLFDALEWLLVTEMAEQYSWGSGVPSGLPRCPCLPGEFFGLTKGPFNPLWCPSGEKSPGLVLFPPFCSPLWEASFSSGKQCAVLSKRGAYLLFIPSWTGAQSGGTDGTDCFLASDTGCPSLNLCGVGIAVLMKAACRGPAMALSPRSLLKYPQPSQHSLVKTFLWLLLC